MKDLPYKNTISPKMKALIIIVLLVFIGVVIGLIVSTIGISYVKEIMKELGINLEGGRERSFTNIYTASVTIICINIMLLVGLLWIYIDSYRKTKSSFLLGLTFFIGVLFIKSIMSLVTLQSLITQYIRLAPAITNALGTGGFGPFGFFLYLFEIIAISIILYLSME